MSSKELFRRLAQYYHPDRDTGDEKIMKEILRLRGRPAELKQLAVKLGFIKITSNEEQYAITGNGLIHLKIAGDETLADPPNYIINPHLVGVSPVALQLAPLWCAEENIQIAAWFVAEHPAYALFNVIFPHDKIPEELHKYYVESNKAHQQHFHNDRAHSERHF